MHLDVQSPHGWKMGCDYTLDKTPLQGLLQAGAEGLSVEVKALNVETHNVSPDPSRSGYHSSGGYG